MSKATTTKKGVALNSDAGKKRATKVIRRQTKRNQRFEIEGIQTAINRADNVDMPDRSMLFDIFKYILRDGHLKSQIKTAHLKVLSEPWMLYKDGQPDEAASKMLRKKWFNKLIKCALEAEFYGFTLCEADGVNPTEKDIDVITVIDRQYVSIDREWILIEGTINGSYLPYGDYKNELDLLQFGDKEDYGCLLECAYNVIWKYYSRSDWSRANEKVGSPILSIVADTNNEDELDAMEEKAANFGSDGYIVGQQGDVISLLERKSDNFHITFKDKIGLCNDEISKIINGQSGTSDMKAWSGSAEVMERTMDDFTQARLQAIADEMRENVFPYLNFKKFGLEGYEFDYPRLRRERERKINGIPSPTDPKETTTTSDSKKKK